MVTPVLAEAIVVRDYGKLLAEPERGPPRRLGGKLTGGGLWAGQDGIDCLTGLLLGGACVSIAAAQDSGAAIKGVGGEYSGIVQAEITELEGKREELEAATKAANERLAQAQAQLGEITAEAEAAQARANEAEGAVVTAKVAAVFAV